MLCASCQDISKKPEFFEFKTSGTLGKYHHSKYTKSVRDAALDSCQVCSMLCLDAEPEHCPLKELDLKYWIEADDTSVRDFTSYSELVLKFIGNKKPND